MSIEAQCKCGQCTYLDLLCPDDVLGQEIRPTRETEIFEGELHHNSMDRPE